MASEWGALHDPVDHSRKPFGTEKPEQESEILIKIARDSVFQYLYSPSQMPAMAGHSTHL